MLAGDVQSTAEREFGWAAIESFFSGDARDLGIVVLLGEMREDDMPRAAVKNFRVGQKFADDRVREMPRAAHHALLDVPRIRPDLQHFEIVVGFEHQAVGIAQVNFHEFGQVAEVGDDRDFDSIRAKGEPQGVDGVVRNAEGRDFNVADDKSLPGPNVLHAVQALVRSFRQDAQHFSVRGFVQINRGAPLAQHLRERADVIGMFVGDDDTVETIDVASDRGKAPQRFFFAKPCVHQQTGLLRLEQGAVARTARTQNRDAQTDKSPRRKSPPRRASPRNNDKAERSRQ